MPISPGGSLYSKEPCQGRVLLSNEVISIALSTGEKHSHSQDLFFKYLVQMIPKYMIVVITYICIEYSDSIYITLLKLFEDKCLYLYIGFILLRFFVLFF